MVTTPTTKAVGFSVQPPTDRPASPKAVPPPVASGATWRMRDRVFQPHVRVAQTLNLLPSGGLPARTGKTQLSTCRMRTSMRLVYHSCWYLATEWAKALRLYGLDL